MTQKLRQDLISSDVMEELVIYDPLAGRAHNLNAQAASVFRACQVGQKLPDTPEVRYCLSLFAEKQFFEEPPDLPKTSRRELLAHLGKAALLPALVTVALPAPAAAMSGPGVTEADCILGVPGSCGQVCTDGPFPGRVCGSDGVNPGCACVPAITATCPC